MDVSLQNYADSYYKVPDLPGLEELVRFPDGEFKRDSIPNSTIWVFNRSGHVFVPHILSDDVGCGIAAFVIGKVDAEKAADKIYRHLKGRGVIGGGNHFVDVCSEIDSLDINMDAHNILLVHSDGKSYGPGVPKSIAEALSKQKRAEDFRKDLGYELAGLLDVPVSMMGNWTHNSVEDSEKVIYRKGVVKVEPHKLHVLPAHLAAKILMYTVDESDLPPYSSMPHATGRSGPTGKMKVSSEIAGLLRKQVYIPAGISDSSLRSEHPSCYNGFGRILSRLGNHIVPLGECRILGYVGKV
ncbi:MAG: hypothetical protein KKD17_00415 [Nanoarchaeota archaeon]|nr:hypothetical protein [Nanoarchaeota archaeon]